MSLAILSLNILHDHTRWPDRAARIRECVDELDPDIVGLQEVLKGNGVDQVEELFGARGYHLQFAAASSFWGGEGIDFGNAVASRWPIAEHASIGLPDKGDSETRSAVTAQIDSPYGRIAFTSTHLNWKFHHGNVRERQVVALCDFVREHRPKDGFPPILVGDFNASPDSAEIRYVKGLQSLEGRSTHFRDAWELGGGARAVGPEDGITWSNRNPYARNWMEPDRRLDYVFVGPPGLGGVGLVEECRVVCDEPRDEVWPSDHFGVFARLRSKAPSQ